MLTYAGIGSRSTPPEFEELIDYVAGALRARDYVVRSGHAPGADQWFEGGAGSVAEVYLPWPTFEIKKPIAASFVLDRPSDDAYQVAAETHPCFLNLSRGARALQARNSHQILGRGLDDPVKFVVCWTPDGSLDGRSRGSGGTGQALRIAAAYEIPVFNLARDEHVQRISKLLA